MLGFSGESEMTVLKLVTPAMLVAATLMVLPAQARNIHRANRASADSTFVMKAAAGGEAEVQMARLAQTKATNPAVKELANKLVEDHTKANEMLKQTVSKMNMSWPTSMDAKAQSEYNRLQNLSGADFDREFARHAVADHKEDISLFQREIDHGSDPEVKGWASQNLPALQEHLRMAESAQRSVGK